jgi:hypothetical protein
MRRGARGAANSGGRGEAVERAAGRVCSFPGYVSCGGSGVTPGSHGGFRFGGPRNGQDGCRGKGVFEWRLGECEGDFCPTVCSVGMN